ncbi:MAG: hypothetical protein MUD08_08300 [Cytophagales bacterium]|nr:hypothetical protein [Cytophagales bacterium]
MKRYPFVILSLLATLTSVHLPTHAQEGDTVYTEQYLRKSTRFAWTHFGGDVLVQSGGTADYVSRTGGVSNTRFGVSAIPRLTIGGMHFWGHADFYVTFPLPFFLAQRPSGFSDWLYRSGVETGARVYPWRLKPGRLSPYAGISFRRLVYGHASVGVDEGRGFPKYERWVSPLQLGVTYTSQKWHFTAGLHYLLNNDFQYALSPTQFGNVTLNPLSFNIGLTRYIDTDRSMASAESARQENAKLKLLKKYRRLSTWYVGIGPSSALEVARSPYTAAYHPYLNDDQSSDLMLDFTFGRYFGKPDLNIGVSYRRMSSRQEAFDTELWRRRRSFMLEAYKFLGNYHGFVPYVGPTLSVESLTFTDNGQRTAELKPALGIIAGWDIRVTRTGTSLLRTNLRWTPNLHLIAEGEKVMFNHLEFNFIQWVHFFGRNKVYQANRK